MVYNAAVELVIQAAQEYFDSSTHLTDISMELAKSVAGIRFVDMFMQQFAFLYWKNL